jgi:hypothetical protein
MICQYFIQLSNFLAIEDYSAKFEISASYVSLESPKKYIKIIHGCKYYISLFSFKYWSVIQYQLFPSFCDFR